MPDGGLDDLLEIAPMNLDIKTAGDAPDAPVERPTKDDYRQALQLMWEQTDRNARRYGEEAELFRESATTLLDKHGGYKQAPEHIRVFTSAQQIEASRLAMHARGERAAATSFLYRLQQLDTE